MQKIFSKIKGFSNNPRKVAYLFILPSMIIFTAFVLIPLLVSIVFSLYSFDMMGNNIKFLGLGNYTKLLADNRFWNALLNTLYFTGGTVPFLVITALLIAVALNAKTKYNAVFKSIYFLPAICSMTIVSIAWSFMLDTDIGIISYYFSLIGIKTIAFLKDPIWAMPTIIVVSIWKTFGFNMVILLAGLQGISISYYEAADIDGASKVKQFFNITLPMLMPTIGFVAITSVINSFQVFDQVFVMTKGGPLFKTETIVQYIYHQGFEVFDMGYASAAAEILLVIILSVSMIMLKALRNNEESF